MSRSPEVPPEALTIRTYAQLDAETAAFFGDYYELFILIGRPGLGKTEAMLKYHAVNPAKSHIITGKSSPLGAYKDCHDYRHRLLIFNDAEVLWDSDNGKTLMRALTEHRTEKTVMWLSSSKQLGDYPTSFKTTSKSAFVMNRFVASKDPFDAAILDRGHLVYFDPPPFEIHRYVADWFWDQEVFDFIGQHLYHVIGLTARAYTLTAEKKAAGLDWKQFFLSRYCDPGSTLWLVQKLFNDPKYLTTDEKITEFIAQGGGCKKTWYNYKAHLEKNGQLRITPPPQIKCKGKPPAKVDRMALIAQLEAAKVVGAAKAVAPSGKDEKDESDAPTDSPKVDAKGGKSNGKKVTTPKRRAGTKQPAVTTLLKVVASEDDDLAEEPLDKSVPPKAKAKKKPTEKNPAAKKKASRTTAANQPKETKRGQERSTSRRATNERTRRRRSTRTDAYDAADPVRIPHLLTHYTRAKCKV